MIFITGCARSGTSLMTSILQAHGLDLGRPINGLYENTRVREKVLKPYLRSIGADPMGQNPLPRLGDSRPPTPYLRKWVLQYVGPKEPWGYKDAKLALVWREWAEAFPEARWIVVRRNMGDIVDSCLRTPFMRAYTDRAGWRDWVRAHEESFAAMKAAGLSLVEVWPERGVDDPKAFAEAVWFAGFRFSRETAAKCIDPKRWHGEETRAATPAKWP